MRVAPVGLARDVNPFALGCRSAAITHGHVTGQLAAGFLAQLVAHLAGGARLERAISLAQDRLREEHGAEETLAAVERAVALSQGACGTLEEAERLSGGATAEETLALLLFAALTARDLGHGHPSP